MTSNKRNLKENQEVNQGQGQISRLINFAKFTRKQPCQSRAEAWNFNKKETLAYVFSSEFLKNVKNIFFTEHLRATSFE